jgi:hypothetical protein
VPFVKLATDGHLAGRCGDHDRAGVVLVAYFVGHILIKRKVAFLKFNFVRSWFESFVSVATSNNNNNIINHNLS